MGSKVNWTDAFFYMEKVWIRQVRMCAVATHVGMHVGVHIGCVYGTHRAAHGVHIELCVGLHIGVCIGVHIV